MITQPAQVSDATWGGKTVSVVDLPEGLAFRLIPRDGLAAYPRTVEVNAPGGRKVVEIADSSWCFAPGATGIKINAAKMPLAALWKTLNSAAVGFDISNPPSEIWLLQVATEECDLIAPAPQLPRVQTLWTVDAPAPLAAHQLASPIFDTAPWRAVLVSMFATEDQALFTVHGFEDLDPGSGAPIAAGLVLAAGAQYGQQDLTSPAGADTQPAQVALLCTNEIASAGASALGNVSVQRLLPFLYGWHGLFGTHRRRVTFRGYR